MSEQVRAFPGDLLPTGIGKTAHGDAVTSLFREYLSRQSISNDTEITPPNSDALDIGQGIDSLSFSAIQTALPSPIVDTDIDSATLPEPTIPSDALNSPRASDSGESLIPPPIHSLSPSTGESAEPSLGENSYSRPELPYGEPLGPELFLGRHSISPLTEQPLNLRGETAPEYYFLTEISEPALSSGSKSTRSTPSAAFDVASVRRDFPALQQRMNGHPLIFLDNAATTQKPRSVIDATTLFYERDNSNIHRAGYELAERATEAFEGARDKVAQFLGTRSSKEIVFTRGTTEAINLVANTFGRRFIGAGDEILLTELEHHANIVPWQILSKQVGASIKVVPINDRGELILEEYIRLLGPRTKLVSVAHVSNSLGTLNPVEQMIQLAHARGVHVLVDGAQSTPHLPVNVQALDADFLVFSGHKVFGPTGIGALYAKSHLLEALPPWQGGGHMIRDVTFGQTVFQDAPEKFEAGTPDIAGAVGLGAAIDYMNKVGIHNITAYEHSLLEYATERLAEIPGLRPIGTAANKASVLSFVIPGIPNDAIASHLDKLGIAVRAGHHCAQPAIRHFGLESSVRPSLAFYNTTDDVEALASGLHDLVKKRLP